MIRKSKKSILMLFLAVCLCLMTACSSQRSESSVDLDPPLAGTISQISEGILEEIAFYASTDAEFYEEEFRSQRQTVVADGIADLASLYNDTGDFVRAISSQVIFEDDTYVCTVNAEFEKRDLEYKIYYTFTSDYQGLEPSAMSFNAEYTLGEKMQKAFLNMILGMGLVFVILIFLSFVIRCFKYINILQDRIQGKGKLSEETGATEDQSGVSAAVLPVSETVLPAEGEQEDLADDLELVAVISAAIAASEDIPADGLRVRSIRRAAGSKWKNQ